MKKNIS